MSEYNAVGPIVSLSESQISCRVYRGRSPLDLSASDLRSRAVTLAMWASADLADVSVLTRGRFLLTSSFVPQAAWVRVSPTSSGSGLLIRFLFGLGTAFASAVSMKIAGFEVSEFAEFIE